MKSTPEQIRQRFDKDVERFANIETGQSATIDAPLVLDLITNAVAVANPLATTLLDIGCGAGNYTLKLLERLPKLSTTLIDLSRPMLDRAKERISNKSGNTVVAIPGDIRDVSLTDGQFDIVIAAAVLHHLRADHEWESVFRKIYQSLKSGGSFWVADLVHHSVPAVQVMLWDRYGQYLTELKGESYRDEVFGYIELEDTPRPLLFQIDLLRQVGFSQVEILHKNNCFAAFGAIK
ncbi:MAG: class I SAM-dependent methyltransferase [Acidobacteria bacterium]|nr:MAG: class I SAM-dependent methyltransferase [Acidobacteriota bacterium]